MKQIFYILFLSLSSCSLITNQPSCSDEETKKIALEILKNRIENDIRVESFSNSVVDSSYEATLATSKNVEKEIQNKVRALNLKSLRLENIITTSKIDSLKKCNCESHIQHDELGKIDFYYYVQITDDGKIYVDILNKK